MSVNATGTNAGSTAAAAAAAAAALVGLGGGAPGPPPPAPVPPPPPAAVPPTVITAADIALLLAGLTGAAQAPNAAPPVPFRVVGSPGEESIGRAINMASPEDKKLYYRAIASVMPKDDPFGLEPPRLMAFINAVRQRGKTYGWDGEGGQILQIPVDHTDPNTAYDNLLNSYGVISMERVRSVEDSYIRTETRTMQDTKMLYECLMASLTEEAKNALQLWEEDYKVNEIGSGVLLLRVIIRESHLDSNAATSVLRTQLSKLDVYMPTVSSDIKYHKNIMPCTCPLRSHGCRGCHCSK